MRAKIITPENLDLVVKQNAKLLAIWCGPIGLKIGHWFLYPKRGRQQAKLAAVVHDVSRAATIKELAGFVR